MIFPVEIIVCVFGPTAKVAGSISFTIKGKNYDMREVYAMPFPGRLMIAALGDEVHDGVRVGLILTLPYVYDTNKPLHFGIEDHLAALVPAVPEFKPNELPIGGTGFQFGLAESTFTCSRIDLKDGKIKLALQLSAPAN